MVAGAAIGVAILVFGVSTLRAEANSALPPPPPLPVSVIEADYDAGLAVEDLYPGIVAARRETASSRTTTRNSMRSSEVSSPPQSKRSSTTMRSRDRMPQSSALPLVGPLLSRRSRQPTSCAKTH